MQRRLAALGLLVCVAAVPATVPEPQGFWAGPMHGAVPASIAGGAIVHTEALAALLHRGRVVLLDVASAPRRPAHLAAGALWLPLPHADIPGSIWLPDAGLAAVTPGVDRFLRDRIDRLSGHDPAATIVVYCHEQCWMSWNAAKRIIGYGYRNVLWYPDGIEGWTRDGHPVAATQPVLPALP